MPPRSRTKPGSTTRRPKVAGLRQHAHAATGTRPLDDDQTDVVETPDLAATPGAVDAPTTDAPADASTDAPAGTTVAPPDDATAVSADDATGVPRREQAPEATVEDADPAPGATTTAPASTEGTRPEAVTGADTSATTDAVTSTGASTSSPADAPDDTATPPVGGDGAPDTGEASDEDRPAARTATPTRTGRGRSTGGAGERSRRRAGMAVRGDGAGTATRERAGRPEHDEDGDDELATVGTTTKKTKRGTGRRTPATGDAPSRAGQVRAGLARFAGSRGLPITLVAVIVVCLVLAGLAFWEGRQAWTSGPASNAAVVDVSATAELVGQTRESIEKIFSYDYTRLDDSVEAARTMSTGQFTERYLSVFDQTIRDPAMQQQLRQTATAVNMGVVSLRDDRAEVMVLAQFSAQRTSTGQSTNAPGLLRAEMLRVDGRWKLAELNPLTANR